MRIVFVVDRVRRLALSSYALHRAQARSLPGVDFARFGRKLALGALVRRRAADGISLAHPVDSVRFFEFDFVRSQLPSSLGNCLDVSSPRLFSLWAATMHRKATISMINPDASDMNATRELTSALRLSNVTTEVSTVEDWVKSGRRYSCIWAISVIEHIWPENADANAVRLLYSALEPGGCLLLTVPVDRKCWVEHRMDPAYNLASSATDLGFPFQRYYDDKALRKLCKESVDREPSVMRWYGERVQGWFDAHTLQVNADADIAALEPAAMANWFAEFSSYDSMPGMGVVGMRFDK